MWWPGCVWDFPAWNDVPVRLCTHTRTHARTHAHTHFCLSLSLRFYTPLLSFSLPHILSSSSLSHTLKYPFIPSYSLPYFFSILHSVSFSFIHIYFASLNTTCNPLEKMRGQAVYIWCLVLDNIALMLWKIFDIWWELTFFFIHFYWVNASFISRLFTCFYSLYPILKMMITHGYTYAGICASQVKKKYPICYMGNTFSIGTNSHY